MILTNIHKWYRKRRILRALKRNGLILVKYEETDSLSDNVARIKPDDGYNHQGDTCFCGPIWAHHKYAKTAYWTVTHRWMNKAHVS